MTEPPRPPWATLYTDIETKLGEPLAAYLSQRREQGTSWRRIAVELTVRTGIDVAGETLRLWHRDRTPAATAS